MSETQTTPQNVQDTKPIKKNSWLNKKVIVPLATILAASQVNSCAPQKNNTNTIPVDRSPSIASEYKYQPTNLNGYVEEISAEKKGGEAALAKDGERIAPEQIFGLNRKEGYAVLTGKFDIGTKGKNGEWNSLGLVDYKGVDDRPNFASGFISMDPKNIENDLILFKNVGENPFQVLYKSNEKIGLFSPIELRNSMFIAEELKRTLTMHYVDLRVGGKIISESWKKTQFGDEVKPVLPSLYIGNCTAASYPGYNETSYNTKEGELFSLVNFSHPDFVPGIKADGPGYLVQVNHLFPPTSNNNQAANEFIKSDIAPSIQNSTLVSSH